LIEYADRQPIDLVELMDRDMHPGRLLERPVMALEMSESRRPGYSGVKRDQAILE
jgi:hypothetical protein